MVLCLDCIITGVCLDWFSDTSRTWPTASRTSTTGAAISAVTEPLPTTAAFSTWPSRALDAKAVVSPLSTTTIASTAITTTTVTPTITTSTTAATTATTTLATTGTPEATGTREAQEATGPTPEAVTGGPVLARPLAVAGPTTTTSTDPRDPTAGTLMAAATPSEELVAGAATMETIRLLTATGAAGTAELPSNLLWPWSSLSLWRPAWLFEENFDHHCCFVNIFHSIHPAPAVELFFFYKSMMKM